MIHVQVHRDNNETIQEIKLSITQDSLPNFIALINRALNCWDEAPKELKDLGDMITHGRITQDHTYHSLKTKSSSDYYTPAESQKLMEIAEEVGVLRFQELLCGDRVELNKMLKARISL